MYKKFFLGILSVGLGISILFVLLAYLLSSASVWKNAYPEKLLNQHRNIAEDIKESKILFISGSNTFHGIDTELISKELNCSAVNFGVSAGLRLDYIFYDAKKSIKNNDIVILPLEYGIYYEDKFSEYRISQIWQDRYYLDKMTFLDKMQLLYSIPFNREKEIISLYFNVYNEMLPEMNKHGDRVDSLETKRTVIIKEPFEKNKVYLDDNTKNIIIDFLNYCKEKNVKVFVTYPSYYYKQKYFDGYNLEQINKINNFWQEQGVIILGQYTDFIYLDKNDFYDTEYHLNIKGREKRTEKLIELLKPYINNN